MKIRKFIAISLCVLFIFSMAISAYASNDVENVQYAISDTEVIIDYASYPIINGTIQYNGKTYELVEYSLISCEDEPEIIVLPVSQTRITDPLVIEELNASIGLGNENIRAIPTNPVDLPFSSTVPEGQWNTITPAFNLIETQFYYHTKLKLDNFPLFADKRFQVIFSYCDPTGTWYSNTYTWNFGTNSTMPFQNMSSFRYGRFSLCNLYGNPSPSYNYTITKTLS